MDWTEISPKKRARYKPPSPPFKKCKCCKQMAGHDLDCPELDRDTLLRMIFQRDDRIKWLTEQAQKNWDRVQILAGKVSILRHENNKLRAANEKLKNANSL